MIANSVKTKNQFAYENLKEEISSGAFPPGEKLIIHKLAMRYGISDSPVREALRSLEAEGAVKNTPHVGYIVMEPDFTDLEQIIEVRQLLEGHATWLAAHHITPSALTRLKSLIDEMNACGNDDVVLFGQLNAEFHDIIYSSCGNTVLYDTIKHSASMAPRTKSIFSLVTNRRQSSLKEHELIYQNLKEGNADKAKEALLSHKQTSYELLLTK